MKKRLLSTALLAAIGAAPADAALRLSISDGASTFTCVDGQLGCDLSGGANNLLAVNTAFDGFFVQLTLAQSSFGKVNTLQLSSSNITATSAGTLTILASDTSFLAPVSSINSSGSLTFNADVGAGPSTLKFWADHANAQGANPNQTPGVLLETATGTPLTDPDSFSGSKISSFISNSPFSMTEGAQLALIAGGSVTGFNQSMVTSAVPEPSTWLLGLTGFGLVGALALRKGRKDRLAFTA
jgi:hypothetical protein